MTETPLLKVEDLRVSFHTPRGVVQALRSVTLEVQPGEVVRVVAPESAKPLYAELRKAIWRAGGHVIGAYQPDDESRMNLSRDFYETAEDSQLDFFPARYMRGLIDEIDQASIASRSLHRQSDHFTQFFIQV